jgi:hypothetical protein
MAFLFRKKRQVVGLLLYYAMLRLIHERLQAGPAVLIVTVLVWIFTAGLSDAPREGLSAYAAFNRGFERLMGDIDAEQLLAQHVGGGGFMLLNNQNANNNHRNDDRELRRQRAVVVERPPAEAPLDEGDAAEEPEHANRRRGKKGRKQRRTVEQRRELQQQRQAAREMGFGNGDDQEARLRLLEDHVAREG